MNPTASRIEIVSWSFLLVGAIAVAPTGSRAAAHSAGVLQSEAFQHYIDRFNRDDEELYVQHIPNARAWQFLQANIPLFECPDKDIEQTYYFRWWTYRKHIKQTPDGFVITEFLPPVGWAGKHNTISCAAGHHLYEGRWLRDPQYLDDYAVFWFRKGGDRPQLQFLGGRCPLGAIPGHGGQGLCHWPSARPDPQLRGVGEEPAGAERPVLADRRPRRHGGLHRRQRLPGDDQQLHVRRRRGDRQDRRTRGPRRMSRRRIGRRPSTIKELVQEQAVGPRGPVLQDSAPRPERRASADVRELHGYTPWYFNLPDPGYERRGSNSWTRRASMPPSARRPPSSGIRGSPSPTRATSASGTARAGPTPPPSRSPPWPTCSTTTEQDVVTQGRLPRAAEDLRQVPSVSQREDGRVVPWIDENLNPQTGDWIARTRLKTWKNGTWDAGKGGEERGKDYNHSTFCDLVISGLVGLRPGPTTRSRSIPLVPPERGTTSASTTSSTTAGR